MFSDVQKRLKKNKNEKNEKIVQKRSKKSFVIYMCVTVVVKQIIQGSVQGIKFENKMLEKGNHDYVIFDYFSTNKINI
jgi:hypothetical protein